MADLTEDEWKRIQQHIADGPDHVYLDTNEDGTCVRFNLGVIHPKAYLDLMEETEDQTDILKRV